MKSRGFSLIELIVAMGLVAVMTGAGLISFRNSTRIQTIEGARERLRQMLVQAKVNSASGKKDCAACGGCGWRLQGWEVRIDTSSNPVGLTLQGRCGPTVYPTPPQATFLSKTVTLPEGIRVRVRRGGAEITPTPFLFRPSGGGVVPEIEANVSYSINLEDPWGNTGTITLGGSGEVQ